MILDDVILALKSRFDTALSVDVYDGPYPPAVNKGDFVLVGSSGEDGIDGAAVDLTLSDLGPGDWLDEAGEVVCSSWSWSGHPDIPARRAAAAGNAVACVQAVREDRTLGGLLVAPGLAEVSVLTYEPRQTAEGAICRFTFSVTYRHVNT